MLQTFSYISPIGRLIAIADKTALLRLDFEENTVRKRINDFEFPSNKETIIVETPFIDAYPILKQTQNWLEAYFNKRKLPPLPPIHFEDTSFRMLVWRLLLDIPYGETVTYGELSVIVAKERRIKKMSAQAIGQAVGCNPISIIVPCHRVIGVQGRLTGYAGGIERKQFLLELEKSPQS